MVDTNGDTARQTNGHNLNSPPPPQPTVAAAVSSKAPTQPPNPSVPLTSSRDDGSAKRPRDARLIHMLLSSLGVTAYQERVPLQLLDFAYRHTSSILSDALHLSSDAYLSQQSRARDGPPTGLKDGDNQVTMYAIQLAIQSRLQYQFNGGNGSGLSKEFLLEMAEARNKIALPKVFPVEWGIRLPHEKYVLTGVPWGLKEEWDTETAADDEEDPDVSMGIDVTADEEGEEQAEEGGNAADLFGDEMDEEPMETDDA